MIRSNEPVMGGYLGPPPVAPTALGADRLRLGPEFLGPSHEAVGFAECMHRHRVAAQVGFISTPREQRAASQQTPVAIAPGARENDGIGRRGEDRFEVAPVGEIYRQRIEYWGRDYMIGDQSVLGDPARPTRGIEPEEPDEAAGRRRERAGRHPGDADARFQSVVLFQGFQCRVDRGGGAGESALRQTASARPLRKASPISLAASGPFAKSFDRCTQRRSVVRAVRPVFRRQPGQQAVPGARRRKRRIGRQNAQPAFGQGLEWPAVPTERRETPQSRLRQTANDDIGQRRGRLSLACGDDPGHHGRSVGRCWRRRVGPGNDRHNW